MPKTNFQELNEGQWSGRALIKDTIRKKTHIVQMNIVAIRPQSMRIDVTTSLGIHLARFVMNENSVSYVLPREKSFYSGAAEPKTLKPILAMSLDPKIFMNMLFDIQPNDSKWHCELNEGMLSNCVNRTNKTQLAWFDRKGSDKKVSVKTAQGEVQIELKDFETKVQEQPGLFELKAPTGYKTQSL